MVNPTKENLRIANVGKIACYYCRGTIISEPFIDWLSKPTIYLHPHCAAEFAIRLLRDVHEVECRFHRDVQLTKFDTTQGGENVPADKFIEALPSLSDLPDDPYRLPQVPPGLYHLSFEELCRLEPALAFLESRIRSERQRKAESYCANQHWIRYFKPELTILVGWFSKHPEPQVRSQEAYDAAYQHLYQLLPDCRNCACIAIDGELGLIHRKEKQKCR
jgi:hypothetical protein